MSERKSQLKQLTRGEDRKLLGVCAGMAEYFNIDPTLARLFWILLTVTTGFFPGLIIYLLAAWVIPEK